jgi:tetrahydromethanopterin S-methyltransferase subunit D
MILNLFWHAIAALLAGVLGYLVWYAASRLGAPSWLAAAIAVIIGLGWWLILAALLISNNDGERGP